jgi:hypothetical protein
MEQWSDPGSGIKHPGSATLSPVQVKKKDVTLQLDLLKLDDDRYSQQAATPPVVTAASAGAATTPGGGLLATDPWADFHQPKKSFYSSSDSDSGKHT